jgi:transcriptional repressor NrdR
VVGFPASTAPAYGLPVRCPVCASLDDKVVDSRLAEDGAAIRRRRECLSCGRRYTTFERLEDVPLVVIKRSGEREPFDRSKIVAGLHAAAKNRPLGDAQLDDLASHIEEEARLAGPEVTSEHIGVDVLERLRALDDVAYMRFASVYKGFVGAADFAREADLLDSSDDSSDETAEDGGDDNSEEES